tara:strand:- start:166 stop:375 length:210 start_codon:yes stop_codon:yes gene_type:complete
MTTRIELSKQEYKNLALEFSYDSDIKPEIYRLLKYNYNIQNIGISQDQEIDLIFSIQDKVLEIYKKNNL